MKANTWLEFIHSFHSIQPIHFLERILKVEEPQGRAVVVVMMGGLFAPDPYTIQ